MPRIVNLSSDYSSEEDDTSDKRSSPVSIQRPAYFTISAREKYLNVNYSHNSMPIVNFKEDEVYCLSRIIGGKVRKFKKDSRTWLHKSSDRAKLTRKNSDCQFFSKSPSIGVSASYSDKLNDKENNSDLLNANVFEQKNVRFQNNLTPEFYGVCCGGNSNRRENAEDKEAGADEDYMYIGDSDADLTYSEEESPVKASSYVEICQQRDQVIPPASRSADCIHVRESDVVMENESLQSLVSDSSVCEQDSSFENLDNYNESGNSIKGVPNAMDLSRKLAPAIEIERESFRENILDYAVNKQATNLPDDMRMYLDDINRKSYRRPRATEISTCSPSGSTRQLRSQSAVSSTSRYNMRSVMSAQKMYHGKPTDELRPARRMPVRKPASKRARLNNQNRQTSEQIEIIASTYPPEVEKCEDRKPEIYECAGPTCSGTDYVIRNTPPSLFVIAGFVIYDMFKSNLDNQ